jgi:hypothetical protein
MLTFLDVVVGDWDPSPFITNDAIVEMPPEPTITPFVLLAIGFVAVIGLTIFFLIKAKDTKRDGEDE